MHSSRATGARGGEGVLGDRTPAPDAPLRARHPQRAGARQCAARARFPGPGRDFLGRAIRLDRRIAAAVRSYPARAKGSTAAVAWRPSFQAPRNGAGGDHRGDRRGGRRCEHRRTKPMTSWAQGGRGIELHGPPRWTIISRPSDPMVSPSRSSPDRPAPGRPTRAGPFHGVAPHPEHLCTVRPYLRAVKHRGVFRHVGRRGAGDLGGGVGRVIQDARQPLPTPAVGHAGSSRAMRACGSISRMRFSRAHDSSTPCACGSRSPLTIRCPRRARDHRTRARLQSAAPGAAAARVRGSNDEAGELPKTVSARTRRGGAPLPGTVRSPQAGTVRRARRCRLRPWAILARQPGRGQACEPPRASYAKRPDAYRAFVGLGYGAACMAGLGKRRGANAAHATDIPAAFTVPTGTGTTSSAKS